MGGKEVEIVGVGYFFKKFDFEGKEIEKLKVSENMRLMEYCFF